MPRRWMMLLTLALGGCMEFDEYHLRDEAAYQAPAAAPCGCPGGPRFAPSAVASSAPPPGAANVVPVPQSREPELLR